MNPLTRSMVSARIGMVALAVALAGGVPASSALAQTATTITYQGRLNSGGATVDGPVDLEFRLFAQPTGGSAIAPVVSRLAAGVTDGLFQAELDFGSVWDGSVRYLEISVRSPAGGGAFTVLSPRQPVTAAPQALRAATVPWAGVTGVPANVLNAYSPWTLTGGGTAIRSTVSLVGVGDFATGAPNQTLDVRGFADSGISMVAGRSSNRQAFGASVQVGPGSSRNGGIVEITGGMGSGSDPSGLGGAGGSIYLTGGRGSGGSGTGGVGGSVFIEGGQPDNSAFGNTADPGNVILTPGPGGLFTADGTVFFRHRNTDFIFNRSVNFWPIRVTNTSQATFAGGMRVSNDGFFDFTNNAQANTQTGFARLNSNGGWSQVSDARLKTDVTPAEGLLDTVLALRPVRYKYSDRPTMAPEVGFIAQEVQAVLPEVVNEGRILTLDYARLSTVAIGAVREMQAQHQAQLKQRDEQIADLRARLARLEAAMAKNAPAEGRR